MQNIIDFLSAALPWLCIGVCLAVLFAENAKRKNTENKESGNKEKKANYATEGMCLGMCFGTALGTALGKNTGIGISLGMLLGLVIGSCIEKKGDKGNEE